MLQKVRDLSKNVAIYGLGDVAVSLVNFALLPLYVQYLTPEDYGVLALLGSVEVVTKIFFRWGLDGAFMRFFHESDAPEHRQRLASTIFFFMAAVNGLLLAIALAASGPLAERLFGTSTHTLALRLMLVNTFAIGFTFFPFHVLRMENRSVQFSVLALARSVSTVVLRIVLIIGAGLGVLGIVISDLLVTTLFMVVLVRWFAPLIRPMFSRAVLRDSLAFGLPRIPHGIAQQVIATADRFVLSAFRPLGEIGIYSMGVSFGLTQKLFLAAFESAWAPFYYATSREADAALVFRRITTYCVAVLVLLTAGLGAIARDLLLAMTGPDYVPAAPVVQFTALGVLFQGVYLLTSIGLNITRHTRYYPVATLVAAGTCVALNLVLVTRFGIAGAACANAMASAVQATLAWRFSQRFYPIAYEGGRLARVLVAGGAAFAAGVLVPSPAAWPGVLVRGTTVVAVFALLLAATGFLRGDELRSLARLAGRTRSAPAPEHETTELAGQIITTELRDDLAAPGQRQ